MYPREGNVWLVIEQLRTMITSSAEGHVTTVLQLLPFTNYGHSAIISILRTRLEWCSLCNVGHHA